MQIQFDPFAFGVAVIAVLIAWRAHYLAKKAPELARRQEIRDEVRELMLALDSDLDDLRLAIDHGQELPPEPVDIDARLAKLESLADRLPENARLLLVHAVASGAGMQWHSAVWDQAQLARAQASLQESQARLEGLQSAEGAARTRQYRDERAVEVERFRTITNASRTRARESVVKYKEQHQEYLDWLNALDRGARKS